MFRLLEHILLGQKELLNNWQIGFSIDILPPCTLQSVQHSPKLALVDQLKQECHAIDSHGAVVRPSGGRLFYSPTRALSEQDSERALPRSQRRYP
jgi:hypothetical protein